MEEVTVTMPLHLTHDLLMAVRNNELTKCEDKDEMNTRIGWLICAYDAMVEARTNPPSPFGGVPNAKLRGATDD